MKTERMVLTLCKQKRSKTAERICILTTENGLWLLLEVGEANIQFTGFTRRCHCSQLPELENDTTLNAFIRKWLSEELNGIRLHKAKCLLTLGKRCWSCWKVTAQLEKVPKASVILTNVLGTGKAVSGIGFYWKVVSEWLFNRSADRSDDLRNAPSPISAKVWSLAAFCVIDATPRSRAIRCVSSCLWQLVLIKVLCCPKVESIFYQKLNISVCSFVVWFVSVYVCGDVDPSLKCSSDLAPARDSQLRDVKWLTHCGHVSVFSCLYLRWGFL